jgi:hypothetical protein
MLLLVKIVMLDEVSHAPVEAAFGKAVITCHFIVRWIFGEPAGDLRVIILSLKGGGF